jgi:hypothetical protein
MRNPSGRTRLWGGALGSPRTNPPVRPLGDANGTLADLARKTSFVLVGEDEGPTADCSLEAI